MTDLTDADLSRLITLHTVHRGETEYIPLQHTETGQSMARLCKAKLAAVAVDNYGDSSVLRITNGGKLVAKAAITEAGKLAEELETEESCLTD